MGTSFRSCQVRLNSMDAVAQSLNGLLKEPAYVSPVVNGWVGVYPEGQGDDPLEIARKISARLSCGVLALLVHDSDVFCYWLYENGDLRDEFNSDPDWGTDPDDPDFPPPTAEERARAQGDPEALLPYCLPGVGLTAIQEVLHPTKPPNSRTVEQLSQTLGTMPETLWQGFEQRRRETYLFADEQAVDVAKLLGIREDLAVSKYRIVAQQEVGNLPEEAFRLVGTENLSQEYKNGKLWGIEPLQNPDTLRVWLARGADPNARDKQGKPVLVHWAEICLPEQINILVESGADVNASTEQSPNFPLGLGHEGGVTPLIAAAGRTYEQPGRVVDTVKLLLEAGANVNARSETGRTALGEALKMTDPAQHQGKIGRRAPEEVLRQAAERSAQVVELLRAAGATD